MTMCCPWCRSERLKMEPIYNDLSRTAYIEGHEYSCEDCKQTFVVYE